MDARRFHLQLTSTPLVSVSIERSGACTLHAGVVYLETGGALKKLHFAWHRILAHDSYAGEAYATPNLDNADAMWLATFCARIAHCIANHNSIPYNLKFDED